MDDVKSQLCPFKKTISWNGSFHDEGNQNKWVWIPENLQFALTFTNRAE